MELEKNTQFTKYNRRLTLGKNSFISTMDELTKAAKGINLFT